jgi:hypothetical protein
VDIDPLVVADAQATELVQSGQHPFYYPTPPPQAATVPRSAPSEEWENMTDSQSPSDALGIVGTIAEYAVETTLGADREPFQRYVVSGNVRSQTDPIPQLWPGPPCA